MIPTIFDTDIFLEKDLLLIKEAWEVLEDTEDQGLLWALYESGWITRAELREMAYEVKFSEYANIKILLAGFTLAINGEEI